MNVSDSRIKVAIVDDHPVALCGLSRAIEAAGFEVVGAVTNPADLLELLDRRPCDIVVTSYALRHGGVDGWRFLSTVATKHPRLPMLVYSDIDDPFVIGSLVLRDVAGIVNKREDMELVSGAIRKLVQGRRFYSPLVESALARFYARPEMRRFGALTSWQMEVTGLMLCGLSVGETSRLLGRGKSTISKRRIMACRQLGFERESDLYRFVSSHGLSLGRALAAPAHRLM
jgi:two-component system, NarL family, captular synthesis response regulator RcsB